MINRVLLFVVHGLGVGPLPDADVYGDADAHTLLHMAETAGGLSLPNMEALGLGHIATIPGVLSTTQPQGCFGRLGFTSNVKDSVAGYWEMSGVVLRESDANYSAGIPHLVVEAIEQALGRKVIGKRFASMSAMVQEYGADHLASGAPIVWTDGGKTCYVAAHEAVMPLAVLHQQCREAWKAAKKAGTMVRIVAQPLTGEAGALHPHQGRKDFVTEPPGVTMLDALNRSGQLIMGIGRVHDVFSGRGLTKTFPALSASEALDETIGMLNKVPRGLLYTGLDLLPDDGAQAAAALEDFDRRLPDLFNQLRAGDVVVLTGDQGRDLSKPSKTPTREYVPLFLTGPKLAQGVDLGTRDTAADLGQTVVEALRAERLMIGESFWEAVRTG